MSENFPIYGISWPIHDNSRDRGLGTRLLHTFLMSLNTKDTGSRLVSFLFKDLHCFLNCDWHNLVPRLPTQTLSRSRGGKKTKKNDFSPRLWEKVWAGGLGTRLWLSMTYPSSTLDWVSVSRPPSASCWVWAREVWQAPGSSAEGELLSPREYQCYMM